MKIYCLLLAFFLNLMITGVFAQNRSWGNLLLPVSNNWSIKQSGPILELSNYNQGEPPLITITLFEKQSFAGKPDSLFSRAWRTHITKLPRTDFVPRWKRVYTDDGMLIQQGFMEFTAEAGGPLYRQLNVFVMENQYQACMLEVESAAEYKKIQNDWMERLRGVVRISEGKK